MSWLSDIGSAVGGVVTTAEGAVTTTADAAHTLLGSGGSLSVGGLNINTGVTQGDVTTTNTNVNAQAALNSNLITGTITDLLSNPIILIGIIAIILVMVMKK